jgi:hypothetical protein
MYLLVLRFKIPNPKLYEFDLTLDRLVKLPVYTMHRTESQAESKIFELVRHWENRSLMKRDLDSPEYLNLIGVIGILGEILESNIYNSVEHTDLLNEQFRKQNS